MSRFQILVLFMLAALTGGVATLWVYQVRTINSLEEFRTTNDQNASANTFLTPEQLASDPIFLSEEIVSPLEASLSSLLVRIEQLEQNQSKNSTAATPRSTTISFQKQVIYLGSTSTTNRDWTSSGLEVILNNSDYPSDVGIVFEAGLSIVGGEAWARLTNKTTGAIINSSEISHGTNTTTWKSSPSFKLHTGSNTYVVELRSTSGEVANLSGARLVIDR